MDNWSVYIGMGIQNSRLPFTSTENTRWCMTGQEEFHSGCPKLCFVATHQLMRPRPRAIAISVPSGQTPKSLPCSELLTMTIRRVGGAEVTWQPLATGNTPNQPWMTHSILLTYYLKMWTTIQGEHKGGEGKAVCLFFI